MSYSFTLINYEGVGVGVLKIDESESEVLKLEESESGVGAFVYRLHSPG
jgi:hypothetical protein